MAGRVGRPPKPDAPLKARIRPDLKAALDAAAREAGVSTARMVETLLELICAGGEGSDRDAFLTAFRSQQ